MIRSPIVNFEVRHGVADPSLVQLAEIRLPALSDAEAHEVYMRMRDAAERGSAFAMCMCAAWPGVRGRNELSNDERYEWARRAAESGYPPGLCELAFCLQNGIGAQKDLARSQDLYERSAGAGFGFAAYRLGMGFMEGHFGAVNASKAIHFMERAYESGEPLGALALGQWFESGEQVAPDSAAALRWYERASELGDFAASHRLQLAYMLGELGLPRDARMARHYETRLFEQTEVGTAGSPSSRE